MIIADLHIHGKHSRATSTKLDVQNLEKYAQIKGVDLLGTGDFTHPKWIEHLKDELTEDGTGIARTRTGFPFIWQTEISLIYTWKGKGRRIHNVVLAPNYEIVQQITEYLKTKGRVDYDGRPIFKIPCPEFTERLKEISKDIEIIPAHIWTPHFSLFGDYNQFNTVEECFEDQTKNIFALETGLSSDPPMNWRLSQLDRYSLVSFSDLHSFWPWRMGREATLFDIDPDKLSYKEIIKAIRTKEKLHGTIEVDPNYGKYHFTGHRACDVCIHPAEALKSKNICPKCKRPLTVGVLQRVEELADREKGFVLKGAPMFKRLIPLSEILAKIVGSASMATKKVWQEYYKIVNLKENRSENDVLLDLSFEELKNICGEKIAKIIIDSREGKIEIKPGYDGVYGVPLIEGLKVESKKLEKNKKKPEPTDPKQTGLGDFVS